MNVVVHGLRHREHLHSLPVEFGGIAEGVIAPNRHQVIESQRLDILQHCRRHVEHRAGHALLGGLPAWKLLPLEHRRQLLHLGGIGARTVQIRAARAIDGAGVLAVERLDIPRPARRIFQIDMRQSFPATADANDLASDLGSPVDHRFND